MTSQRVAILDGSRSLFETGISSSSTKCETLDDHIWWQPIPGLEGIVVDAVKEVASVSGVAPSSITPIGIGVICDTSTVSFLVRAIHTKVLKKLLDI